VCSAEELKNAENDAFLEWRRKLAVLQEERDALITPYEKNLEFWRQLWRVIERSDLVIQVIVPRKETGSFLSGPSPRRHRAQRSRHSGEYCAGKRKQDLLVWRQLWRVIERSDLIIQVIVPEKENPLFWSGTSPWRHQEQQSRHSGDCAWKRKHDRLVWRQPRASSRAAISSFR
jgi:hypothetical protein